MGIGKRKRKKKEKKSNLLTIPDLSRTAILRRGRKEKKETET
jgi:hypothetical protein